MKKIAGLVFLFAVAYSLAHAAATKPHPAVKSPALKSTPAVPPQSPVPNPGLVKKPTYNLEGIITQINQGDGSFNIRLRDGKIVTVASPFQTGAFLGINTDLSKVAFATSVTNISQIAFMDRSGPDAIPAITDVSPGLVAIGDIMNISGGPFMKQGNDVFINGPVSGFIKNLGSQDGKTLPIKIPAKLCTSIADNICSAATKLNQGEYELSITNANGLSNSAKFNVKDTPALALTTEKLAEPTQGVRYAMPLTATGGTDSYAWKVSSGSLPDGLKLVVPPCTASPCRPPATISGIPKTSGTYTFGVTLTSGDEAVSRDFSVTIIQAIDTTYYSGTGN